MSKFNEATYNHWKRSASKNEENRISNVINMIKKVIRNSYLLFPFRYKNGTFLILLNILSIASLFIPILLSTILER